MLTLHTHPSTLRGDEMPNLHPMRERTPRVAFTTLAVLAILTLVAACGAREETARVSGHHPVSSPARSTTTPPTSPDPGASSPVPDEVDTQLDAVDASLAAIDHQLAAIDTDVQKGEE
jgi:hypothetical protein